MKLIVLSRLTYKLVVRISLFDSISPNKPKLTKQKLEIYFFSFWGVHENFDAMAGLNYRFIGNLHVCVCFQHDIKLVKRLLSFFHQYTFLFLRILFLWPLLSSNFSNKVYILLNILDLLVSINIHLIKITTSNLADVWYIFHWSYWHFIMCRDWCWLWKYSQMKYLCTEAMHVIRIE